MNVIISAHANATIAKTKAAAAAKALKQLDGLETDEECSDHLGPPLSDIGIIGGSLKLVYDKSRQTLELVTRYRTARQLTKRELNLLVEFTESQWADGIGESAFEDQQDSLGLDLLFEKASQIRQEVDAKQGRPGSVPRLFAAAREGKLDMLKQLLLEGADIRAEVKGNSPLIEAVLANQCGAALFLIEQGAVVTAKEKFEELQRSTMSGLIDVVAALIARGADVNGIGLHGYTPLMWAANRGHTQIAALLLAHGAKVNARVKGQRKTPLICAETAPLELVELLLKHGADPAFGEVEGRTPGQEAANYALRLRERGDPDATEWEARAALYRRYEKKTKRA